MHTQRQCGQRDGASVGSTQAFNGQRQPPESAEKQRRERYGQRRGETLAEPIRHSCGAPYILSEE